MLDIQTFDSRAGGNVLYKALAHPLAAEGVARIYAALRSQGGPLGIYDPEGIAAPLLALNPSAPDFAALFVHDTAAVGQRRAGLVARPVTELPGSGLRGLLLATFDSGRTASRIAPLLPEGARMATLDEARLPGNLLTVPNRYLDKLNFATNFAFFRDQDGLSTRLVTANYWSAYGAQAVRLWLRLFDANGTALATWEQPVRSGAASIVIDSQEVRRQFSLPPFTGQLFVHVIGAAGHDVVKYALDTYASDSGPSLSCTHDANAWPSDRYAGLPAPRDDERVVLWLQNSHAAPIPAGAIALDRMGAERPVSLALEVGPFATIPLDVSDFLPGLRWPAQVEVRAARHVVRPRYEVVRAGRTRIAHVNVERSDLRPDPAIRSLPESLGRGFLLPFPVLDPARFRSIVQPTPMAQTQRMLPVRIDMFDQDGRAVGRHSLGCLDRAHNVAVDVSELDGAAEGHAELVYDFSAGGEADGWLHALFRYEHRETGHAAESSFGAHIFNTIMTYRDEPQSYSGPPPGLSTRLFLRLGEARRRSFAVLIYPASAPWRPRSSTSLLLHDADGTLLAEERISIPCSGSATVWPHQVFGAARLPANGYILVRDATCRLFGYHGLMDEAGGFSLDHMFGF